MTTSGKNDISCDDDALAVARGAAAAAAALLNEKRAGPKPRTFASGVAAKSLRISSQTPRNVAGTERGVRPIGD